MTLLEADLDQIFQHREVKRLRVLLAVRGRLHDLSQVRGVNNALGLRVQLEEGLADVVEVRRQLLEEESLGLKHTLLEVAAPLILTDGGAAVSPASHVRIAILRAIAELGRLGIAQSLR